MVKEKFMDEVTIYVAGGKGGDGCVSFRREKFIEFGGPDGGDGGDGGNVYITSNSNTRTLLDLRYKRHFRAKDGANGSGQKKTGARGKDKHIVVPIGTQVFAEDNELLCDLCENNKTYMIARGGSGGWGNARFKTAHNRAPKFAKSGEETEDSMVFLQLKILSDVGIIGFPNAGKSTFLSSVTRARPKIADYMFTTLFPEIGVVDYEYDSFVIADIPGLLEGASDGHGLGDRFLRHVERCPILLHMIDSTVDDCIKSYESIQDELKKYNTSMLDKKQIVVLSKADMLSSPEVINEKQRILSQYISDDVYIASIQDKKGLSAIIEKCYEMVLAYRKSE